MEIKETLQDLNDRQKTISELINLGQILVKTNGCKRLALENDISIDTIYDTKDVSISIASCPTSGDTYPEHCHVGIVEYLICLKGSFGVTLSHNGYRIVKEQECAKIPANILHSVISLEPNSDLMGICLPAEPAYKSWKGA